jgi:hypothetical protein
LTLTVAGEDHAFALTRLEPALDGDPDRVGTSDPRGRRKAKLPISWIMSGHLIGVEHRAHTAERT